MPNNPDMPVCEKCKEAVDFWKYCPSCGTPTQLGRQAIIEETRFQTLGDAITNSYSAESSPSRWKLLLRKGSPGRFVLAVLAIVAIVAAAGFAIARVPRTMRAIVQTRAQTTSSQQLASQRLADQRFAEQQIAADSLRAASPAPASAPTVAPSPTLAPSPTPAPTQAPTATPAPATPAPSQAPIAGPTEAAVSTAPATIHNAPLLVRSIGVLKVGKPGSCGGLDATIDFPGHPRGCTVFDAVSSGPLKNRRGTVLVVPVSTSEDASDTAYGLVYVQTDADSPPHYLGALSGGESGPLKLRVEDGLIVVQGPSQTRYFTFDGQRITPA